MKKIRNYIYGFMLGMMVEYLVRVHCDALTMFLTAGILLMILIDLFNKNE